MTHPQTPQKNLSSEKKDSSEGFREDVHTGICAEATEVLD